MLERKKKGCDVKNLPSGSYELLREEAKIQGNKERRQGESKEDLKIESVVVIANKINQMKVRVKKMKDHSSDYHG